jgi:hypothetical protein
MLEFLLISFIIFSLKSNRRDGFDQSTLYACMCISQWNPFVQQIYANNKIKNYKEIFSLIGFFKTLRTWKVSNGGGENSKKCSSIFNISKNIQLKAYNCTMYNTLYIDWNLNYL